MVQKISLHLQTSLKNTDHGPSVMATSSFHNSTKYKAGRDKPKRAFWIVHETNLITNQTSYLLLTFFPTSKTDVFKFNVLCTLVRFWSVPLGLCFISCFTQFPRMRLSHRVRKLQLSCSDRWMCRHGRAFIETGEVDGKMSWDKTRQKLQLGLPSCYGIWLLLMWRTAQRQITKNEDRYTSQNIYEHLKTASSWLKAKNTSLLFPDLSFSCSKCLSFISVHN